MSLQQRLSKLGYQAQQTRLAHRSGPFRWPANIRKGVLDLLASGATSAQIERGTGIAMATSQAWQPIRHGSTPVQKPSFKELTVVRKGRKSALAPSPEAGSISIHTAAGMKILGLGIRQVEEWLKKGLIL